jgi:uncharacterized protein YndB with AHSA1/START domain
VFELFSSRIDEWWPKATHSVGGEDAARVVVEPGDGGRIYEVSGAGVEHEWGRITSWDPGARIELTWHPGVPETQSTHIELTFRAMGGATQLTLVHDGWERRGLNGPEMRDNYDAGWDHVLALLPGSMMAPAS